MFRRIGLKNRGEMAAMEAKRHRGVNLGSHQEFQYLFPSPVSFCVVHVLYLVTSRVACDIDPL